MATMIDVDDAFEEFTDVIQGIISRFDNDKKNSVYTPTLIKALDDIVAAFKRAVTEFERQQSQKKEAEARAMQQERRNVVKTVIIGRCATDLGVVETNI